MVMNVDPEGFLIEWNEWSAEVAIEMAQTNDIQLSDNHWEIIVVAQNFYKEFDHAPSQRPLARFIKLKLSADKAASIYLMQLFGQSPAKMIARLAGLPKPKNCL